MVATRTATTALPHRQSPAADSPARLPTQHLQPLSPSAKAVLTLLGPEAVENVHRLGQRLLQDPQLHAQLNSISDITAPESYPQLATHIPDFLLAEYTLRTSLGRALHPGFFRQIPASGPALCTLAKSLCRALPTLPQLQEAIAGSETSRSLFSIFSPSQINAFHSLQTSAYLERLKYSGDHEGAQLLALPQPDSIAARLTHAMTIATLEALRQAGPQLLGEILGYGRFLANQKLLPTDHHQLHTGIISAIPIHSGNDITIPPHIVEAVITAHRQAWRTSRQLLLIDTNHTPRSNEHFGQISPCLNRNLNFIQGLMLLRHLGAAGALHEALISSALPQPGSTKHRPVIEIPESPSTPSVAHQITLATEPERIEAIQAVISATEIALLARDREETRPTFAELEKLNATITDQKVIVLVQHLRELSTLRSAFLRQVWIASFTLPDLNLSASDAESLPNERLMATLDKNLQSFRDAEAAYERQRLAILQFLNEHFPSQPDTARRTEWLTTESVPKFIPSIRALIRENRRHPSSDRGGLFDTPESWSAENLRHYITQGGRILVLPFPDEPTHVAGLFRYSSPSAHPPSISSFIASLTLDGKIAFSDKFIAAATRPKGTYDCLLRMHVADSALSGADFLLGTIHHANQHHIGILVARAHTCLREIKMIRHPDDELYYPMLYRIPKLGT